MKKIIASAIIREELLRRGYSAEPLRLGQNFTRYVSPSGGVWVTHNGYVAYPFIIGSSKTISKNKELSAVLTELAGVSTVPTLLHVADMDASIQFMRQQAPIIAKPLNSQGGQGVSLNIMDEQSLLAAIEAAKVYSSAVLLQRQFDGEEIRITVSRGEMLVAISRRAPRVIGDGTSSIKQLIAQENSSRANEEFKYMAYPQLTKETIPEHWLSDEGVPAEGEVVGLSRNVLASRGGTFHNISADLHPDYKTIAIRLADMLNPEFLVIDFLVKDYTQPATAAAYTFLEFTTSPALYVYYSLRGGPQYDIVTMLADMIDEYCQVGGKSSAGLSE